MTKKTEPDIDLNTAPVEISSLEAGFLMSFLLDPKHRDSPIARDLYIKLKAAAVANGVVWYYADPKGWEGP